MVDLSARHQPGGLRVLLGKACGQDIEIDRLLVVRYLPGERYFLNEEPANETSIRPLIRRALERRVEKIVWVAADRRVTYGGVTAIISQLQADTPDLHIALATESQIGPVDPAEIHRLAGRRPDGTYIGVMPCVASDL